jgi:ribosomal protein S20
MAPWRMAFVTNKSDSNNHSKLKTCTYEFEKSFHENCKHKKCQHEILKTYISKCDTIKKQNVFHKN